MERKNVYTLLMLIVLTVLTAFFSGLEEEFGFLVLIILVLSAFKFLLVFFRFMEMHKANLFWRIFILVYLFIFILIISLNT